MIYLVAMLVAVTVALMTLAAASLVPGRPAAITRRLAELEQLSFDPHAGAARRQRQTRREQMESLLRQLGARMERRRLDSAAVRLLLVQAGFRGPNAVSIYWGVRLALPLAVMLGAVAMSPLLGPGVVLVAVCGAAMGFVLPAFYLGRRIRARQAELRLALADALDALVVCVEAGLGMNAALLRVADEIRHISRLMSDELTLVNLEMRAGTPREDALRRLVERTGVDDISSLVSMLIQTERFGTSVAQALRVHSDTLRTKRRQRAEEAAAKTAVKMLFPLVFLIFPAMFTVLLGPAVMKIAAAFTALMDG